MKTTLGEMLINELRKRQERNPRYSLRGFARDLNMDASTLSKIMRGKRPLSQMTGRRIFPLLKLEETDAKAYLELLFGTHPMTHSQIQGHAQSSPEGEGNGQVA